MLLLQFIFVILVSSGLARRSSSHSYPHSSGHSGYGSHQSHHYSSGSSGVHSYPVNHNGLSGTGQQHQQHNQHTQHAQHNSQHNTAHTTKSEVHHHYHYNPPQHIVYGAHTLPVYHGTPPVYVYQYRDSGSRFDNLLTGLALYNLGKMSSRHYHDHDDYKYNKNPHETCKLGISKSNGDYEETRVDCQLMSSFIWETQESPTHNDVSKNLITTSVVTTNSTNGTVTSSVTVTNSTTVVDALSAKGPSIEVKPGMTCYLIRSTGFVTNMKKSIDCGVLQTYAMRSLHPNSSEGLTPKLLPHLLLIATVIYQLLERQLT